MCTVLREEAVLVPAETGQENRFVCLLSPTLVNPSSASLQLWRGGNRGNGGHDKRLTIFSQADLLLSMVEETTVRANGTQVYP